MLMVAVEPEALELPGGRAGDVNEQTGLPKVKVQWLTGISVILYVPKVMMFGNDCVFENESVGKLTPSSSRVNGVGVRVRPPPVVVLKLKDCVGVGESGFASLMIVMVPGKITAS